MSKWSCQQTGLGTDLEREFVQVWNMIVTQDITHMTFPVLSSSPPITGQKTTNKTWTNSQNLQFMQQLGKEK